MNEPAPKTPPLDLEVDVAEPNPLWTEALPGAQGLCQDAARAAYHAEQVEHPDAQVSIVLADDEFVRGLNRDYRDQDKATNVLSFPAGEGAQPENATRLRGDIVVAYETTAGEASSEGKTLGDHLCHMVVHGMLHLLGHDHRTAPAAKAMEKLEIDVLAGLGIASPYKAGPLGNDQSR